MPSKIKDKFKKKISKEYNDTLYALSNISVNMDLKVSEGKDTIRYSEQINDAFNHFLPTYHNIISYLYYDFEIKNLDKTNLKDELELIQHFKDTLYKTDPRSLSREDKKVYNKFNKFKNQFSKKLDLLKIQRTNKRWKVLSEILKCYKDTLTILLNKTGTTEYKEININNEIELLNNNKHLIATFTA